MSSAKHEQSHKQKSCGLHVVVTLLLLQRDVVKVGRKPNNCQQTCRATSATELIACRRDIDFARQQGTHGLLK